MSINFENQIDKVLNEDMSIPKSILDKKELAFEQIRKSKSFKNNRSYHNKVAAAAVTGLCIFGAVNWGNIALADMKALIFSDGGVQKAVDNGYIQKITANNLVKNKGVEVKATDVAYDKNKLALSLDLKFEDKNLLKYFSSMTLDYDITDDKGRYIRRTGNGESLTESSEISTQADKDTGEIKCKITLFSNGKFQDIHNISLKINDIQLYALLKENTDNSLFKEAESKLDKDTIKQLQEAGVRLYKKIDGTWKTNISIDSKFANAKGIKYNAEGNNDFIKVTNAEMEPTGMQITFIADYVSDINSIIDNVSIIDDKGNVYEQAGERREEYVNDKKIKITLNFEATTFDNLGNLKLVAKDSNGKNIEIKLNKIADK